MSTLSEAGLVGTVLFLVFAAVCYYLYMRISQVERKVNLLENILFDLKTATEHTLLSNEINNAPLPSFEYNPEEQSYGMAPVSAEQIKEIKIKEIQPFKDSAEEGEGSPSGQDSPTVGAGASTNTGSNSGTSVTKNYESMPYAELKELARGVIKGFTHMTKKQLAESLRRHDAGEPPLKFDYSRGSDSETVSLQNYKDLDQNLDGSDTKFGENVSTFL